MIRFRYSHSLVLWNPDTKELSWTPCATAHDSYHAMHPIPLTGRLYALLTQRSISSGAKVTADDYEKAREIATWVLNPPPGQMTVVRPTGKVLTNA